VRRDEQRLRDILDAIGRIERAATRGRGAFDADEVWSVVERDLPVLKGQIEAILRERGSA
jgi:uncharacterized protein with HEPN domain